MTTPRTIWKLTFDVTDEVTLKVPAGFDLLPHVHADTPGRLSVWAIVSPEAADETLALRVVGTGNPLGDLCNYVGTAVAPPFVWHVFRDGRSTDG